MLLRRSSDSIVRRPEKPPVSKYSSTSGLLPREHLESQAEFHASIQVEDWLSCPNSARTLRSESEMERNPEVPASTVKEALFQCTKPSCVRRGPCHLQFPSLLKATMRSPLRSPAQVEGSQGFLLQPEKDLERPSSTRLEVRFPYHDSRAMTLAIITQMSSQESRSSTGNYQANEQAGLMHLCWQLWSQWTRRNHSAQLAIIKPFNRQ